MQKKTRKKLQPLDNENVKMRRESTFYNKKQKCLSCGKARHMVNDSRLKKLTEEQTKAQPVNSYKCGDRNTSTSFLRSQNQSNNLIDKAEGIVKKPNAVTEIS